MKCDFCSSPNDVAFRYPCETFETSLMEDEVSLSDWAACSKCAALIDDTDLRGLALRSLNSIIILTPELREHASAVYTDLALLHQEFFQHRSGAAIPLEISA